LAGDSAGGGLALALLSRVKNADPAPRSVVEELKRKEKVDGRKRRA
jgi:hypothetical protein